MFLCQDTVLGRRVAIKLIKDAVMDPESLARFQREVQSMAQLVHPNVVTIFDIGQEDGRYYLVLELMEGGNAEDQLANPLRVSIDTARGLAHRYGILHRGIKPGNVCPT